MNSVKWLTLAADGGELAQPAAGWERWTKPTPPIPRPGRRELIFDAVLAFVLVLPYKPVVHYTLSMPGEHHADFGVDKGTAVRAAVMMLVPMLGRRRFPLAALWFVLVELFFFPAPLLNVAAVVVLCAYSAAVYSPFRPAALASLPVAVLDLVLHDYLDLVPGNNNLIIIPVALPLIAAAAFYGTEVRRAALTDLGEQRRRRADQQQEEIRRAVEDERSRIARELHDVVTHNVSVMVVMAGAARKVLERSPEQATNALLEVEAAGRAAMGSCAR